MRQYYYRKYFTFLVIAIFGFGCKKEFLDAKPSTDIVTPKTFAELEGLLENERIFNHSSSALPQMASDEYYFLDFAGWQATSTKTERNSYTWETDLFGGERNIADWNAPYSAIFYSNNVLDVLSKMPQYEQNSDRWSDLYGWALFLRAFYYYDLVSNFSPAYDNSSANIDLGVPLRLKPGIDEIAQRSTLEATYKQIISDLNGASSLLNSNVASTDRNRPTKVSTLALLARIYLNMREYNKAEIYADSTLAVYKKLIDFNKVNFSTDNPFILNNDETLFSSSVNSSYFTTLTHSANSSIAPDSDLVRQYDSNDLRKKVFFGINSSTKNLYVKTGYFGLWPYCFTGLATDEIFLIKAECAVRRNDITTALTVLDTLVVNRYKTGTFIPFKATNSQQALNIVLTERRKELVWRCLRWSDIKRLNKEGANIQLKRILNGTPYTLPPNDTRYIFPIPDDEIALSGIEQNSR